MTASKGIITIAVGEKYAKQARYLAMSCMLHCPWITRAVITDRPELLDNFYDITVLYKKEMGQPFSLKTRLYDLSPFEKTLYIDSDSLVVNNVDVLWDYIKNRTLAYEGAKITGGVWYYDINDAMRRINVPWIPKFNSGMFLFNKDEAAKAIFETAYKLMTGNNELGIEFFRGNMLPDEPYLAAAFALNNIIPIDYSEECGRFSRTLIGADHVKINSVKGFASFNKNEKPVFPLIVHFCGGLGGLYYFREKFRLILYYTL
jgi:hypothetical protein